MVQFHEEVPKFIGYFPQYQPRRCHESMSPVKATCTWYIAYGEQLTFTGIYELHNSSVAGTGKSTIHHYFSTTLCWAKIENTFHINFFIINSFSCLYIPVGLDALLILGWDDAWFRIGSHTLRWLSLECSLGFLTFTSDLNRRNRRLLDT